MLHTWNQFFFYAGASTHISCLFLFKKKYDFSFHFYKEETVRNKVYTVLRNKKGFFDEENHVLFCMFFWEFFKFNLLSRFQICKEIRQWAQNRESKLSNKCFFYMGTHCWTSTNQRNSQGKEPGVNEKVVSTDLDDVEEQWGHRQQDALGHHKLLHSILEEEPYRLRKTQDNVKKGMGRN